MGNNPHLGVDPDGGLFGFGPVLSGLSGAGIGFAVGALAGLAFDKDNWEKYAFAGAGAGLGAGLLTADYGRTMGNPKIRSTLGDNARKVKVEKLKYPKFSGELSKEFTLFDYKEHIPYGYYTLPFRWGIRFGSKFKDLNFSFDGNSFYDGKVFRNNRDIGSFSISRNEVTSEGNANFLLEGETFMSGMPIGRIHRYDYNFKGGELSEMDYSVKNVYGSDQFGKVKIKAKVRKLTHQQYMLLRYRGWKP